MKNRDTPPDSATDFPRLAELVEQITERLVVGRMDEVDRILQDNPADAERLRRILPMLIVLSTLDISSAPSQSVESVPPEIEGQKTESELDQGLASVGRNLTESAFVIQPGVLGDFRIVREVGRGGMGIVYEAEQISLRRSVALKVLPLGGLLDDRVLQRFRNEAQAAAGLHHPHIVPIHGVGCERGLNYIAMQFIEGVSLDRAIRALRSEPNEGYFENNGSEPSRAETIAMKILSTERSDSPMSFHRRVAELGADAADALHHAHEQGIIHRDIKPGNLMLDHRGKLWVTDFGLARIEGVSQLTITGDLIGTLRYMSPEQALGNRLIVDHRTDIYSLGTTLYELLSGRAVFEGSIRGRILHQIAEEEPTPLRQLQPTIHVDLETIILKSIAKGPEDRYESASDLSVDLRRYLAHLPVQARRPTSWQRAKNVARRHSAVLLATSTGMVVVTLVAMFATVLVWQAKRATDSALHQSNESLEIARQRELFARQHLYVADISAAHQAGLQDDQAEMRTLLVRHIPRDALQSDLRGFEWHYLWGVANAESRNLVGHQGQVYCTDFSSDSQALATGGSDGVIRLWNVESGKIIRELHGHTLDVNTVQFFPDGRKLISAGGDGTARLWDIDTGNELHSFCGHEGEVTHALLSPTEDIIATGGLDRNVCLYNATNNSLIRVFTPHENRIHGMAFSPDGERLITATGGGPVIGWNVQTGEKELELTTELGGAIKSVSVSQDGRMIVAGHEELANAGQGGLSYWIITGKSTFVRATTITTVDEAGHSVEFLPSRYAAASTTNSGNVRIWEFTGDLHRWRLQSTFRRHRGGVWRAQVSPDEQWLVSSSRTNELKLTATSFDVTRSYPVCIVGEQIRSVQITPDARVIAFGGSLGKIKILVLDDAESIQPTDMELPFGEPIVDLILSPDQQWLAAQKSTSSQLLSLSPDAKVGGPWQEPDPAVVASVFSADSRRIACIESDGINYTELRSRHVLHRFTCPGVVHCKFSPDGKWLAGGTQAGDVYLWDLTNDFQQYRLESSPSSELTSMEFAHDSTLVATGTGDGVVKLWSVETLQELKRFYSPDLSSGLPLAVNSVAFSPDNRTLAIGRNESFVRLWHIATGRELLAFRPLSQLGVKQVCFSPDGRRLIAVGPAEAPILHQVAIWSTEKAR